jgi:hypothetical protein
MRMLMAAAVASIVLSAANPSFAQQNPPSGAEESKQGASPGVRAKRQACRQEGQGKGQRGADLQDYVVVCVAEARLTCLKQAVADKVRGQARRDFINKCLSS